MENSGKRWRRLFIHSFKNGRDEMRTKYSIDYLWKSDTAMGKTNFIFLFSKLTMIYHSIIIDLIYYKIWFFLKTRIILFSAITLVSITIRIQNYDKLLIKLPLDTSVQKIQICSEILLICFFIMIGKLSSLLIFYEEYYV